MVQEGRGRILYLSRRPYRHSRSPPSLSWVHPRLRGNLRLPKLQFRQPGSIRRQPNGSCAYQASCSLQFNSAAPAVAQPPYVPPVLPRCRLRSIWYRLYRPQAVEHPPKDRRASEGEIYVVTLRPLPDINGATALRSALKALLRYHRLRAVSVERLD